MSTCMCFVIVCVGGVGVGVGVCAGVRVGLLRLLFVKFELE